MAHVDAFKEPVLDFLGRAIGDSFTHARLTELIIEARAVPSMTALAGIAPASR